jgi:hypothetical protein
MIVQTRARKRSNWGCHSFGVRSLTTTPTIGIFVGSVGVALNTVWFYRQTSWEVTATVQGLLQMLIVTVLVTIVLEQRRKRAIRRTLELAFLNHHVRNALTQMGMISYIADPEKREHLLQDAVARVSEVLFRIANSVDLTGLCSKLISAGRSWPTREKRESRAT